MKITFTIPNKDIKTWLNYYEVKSKSLSISIDHIRQSKKVLKVFQKFFNVYNKNYNAHNIIQNPYLDPLSLFMLNINSIEIKSLRLRNAYTRALKSNDFLSASILMRSDLELNFLFYFYIGKSFEFLNKNLWLIFYKLSIKIFFGKDTKNP